MHELRVAGVTENFAIRTLELFADVYSKLYTGGSATPHHVRDVPKRQWSRAARRLYKGQTTLKPKDGLRVEHGTPRRAFARMVLELYDRDDLTEATLAALVAQYWKLAVITLEEDARLNTVARSKHYDTPDERWSAAGIRFD